MADVPKLKKTASWSSIKDKLSVFDKNGLLFLIHDLYAASKDNQAFLHARFGLGTDVLKPYKAVISRWVNPNVVKDQQFSISKAKKAIADYRKAVGSAEGLAELTTFYCEQCVELLSFCGMEDESYFNALVLMYEQAVKAAAALEGELLDDFIDRLERVKDSGQNYGYGVGDDMEELFLELELEEES